MVVCSVSPHADSVRCGVAAKGQTEYVLTLGIPRREIFCICAVTRETPHQEWVEDPTNIKPIIISALLFLQSLVECAENKGDISCAASLQKLP